MQRLLTNIDTRPVLTVAPLRLIFQTAPPLNYALAMTTVRWRDHLVGSALGLPVPVIVMASCSIGSFTEACELASDSAATFWPSQTTSRCRGAEHSSVHANALSACCPRRGTFDRPRRRGNPRRAPALAGAFRYELNRTQRFLQQHHEKGRFLHKLFPNVLQHS